MAYVKKYVTRFPLDAHGILSKLRALVRDDSNVSLNNTLLREIDRLAVEIDNMQLKINNAEFNYKNECWRRRELDESAARQIAELKSVISQAHAALSGLISWVKAEAEHFEGNTPDDDMQIDINDALLNMEKFK
jgi:hypothetical protein